MTLGHLRMLVSSGALELVPHGYGDVIVLLKVISLAVIFTELCLWLIPNYGRQTVPVQPRRLNNVCPVLSLALEKPSANGSYYFGKYCSEQVKARAQILAG